MTLRPWLFALATTALLAPVAAAGVDASKVVIYERDVLYDFIATNGFDYVTARGSSFKHVEVRVVVQGFCDGLAGQVALSPTPPPPIPPAVVVTRFTCADVAAPVVLGAPGIPVYQAKDMPMLIEFSGVGRTNLRLQILGEPWS